MRIALLALVFGGVCAVAQDGPAPADVDARTALLAAKASREDRLQAVRWLGAHAAARHAPRAMPALASRIRTDADPQVREQAVVALSRIAREHRKPCPLVLVEAIRDQDDSVRLHAGAMVSQFRTEVESGAVAVLIDGLRDDRADVRCDCLVQLAITAPKDPKARTAIESAKDDRNSNVRHTAHCARFTATNDLGEFLTYLIRMREEPGWVKDAHAPGSAEEKAEQCRYNLYQIGGAIRLVEWSEQRPDELAAALVKLLKNRSPILRRGAATVVGATARKVEIKPGDLLAPPVNRIASSLLPYFSPDASAPKVENKPNAATPSRVAGRLRTMKIEDQLRELRDRDSDESVRVEAFRALLRLAEVPARPK